MKHEGQTKPESGALSVNSAPVHPPSFLKPFVGKTPAQFLGKYYSQKKVEAAAGIMSGLVPDFGVPVPDWAREASKQFWKYYGFPKNCNPLESARDLGLMIGMLEHWMKHPEPAPKSLVEKLLSKTGPKFIAFITKGVVLHFSHREKSEFHAGAHQATEILAKLENPKHLEMQKLAPIYLVVSVAWRELESLKTHADREDWLRAKDVIKDNVTSREVYQAFGIIGLPGAKPGRPKLTEF